VLKHLYTFYENRVHVVGRRPISEDLGRANICSGAFRFVRVNRVKGPRNDIPPTSAPASAPDG
jgi:hypothetical protein